MRSKLSFVEAISTCFSQCYVSTLFIFVDRRPQDREKEKSKNRGKKEGLPSISGEQLPFTTGLCRSHRRTALPLPFLLLLRCLLHSPLFVVSFAFSFLHCISTVPQSITAALLFPFPFSFSFVWAALHCLRCM